MLVIGKGIQFFFNQKKDCCMSIISFLEVFSSLEDPRISGMVTYPMNEILLVTLCGVLCKHQDWDDIRDWGKHHLDWVRQFCEFKNGIPTTQTFARVFGALDSKKFKLSFESWVNSLGIDLRNKQIAIDGKTVRGSKRESDGSGAIHLISAFAYEAGLVIGQEKVDEKSNEITAIPELLERLAIEGSIITIDAIATQKEIVQTIVAKRADYVLALKKNQPNLYEDVRLFFQEENKETIWDEHEETDTGHGRIEIRKCITTTDISWLRERYPEWQNLTMIAMVEGLRINKKTLKESRETRYYISSLKCKAKDMGGYIRNHWSIENKLHWVLDMHFKEDSCRTRIDHGAENLATVRKIAINLVRRHAACLEKKVSIKRLMNRSNWDLPHLQSLISVNNL